MSLLYRPLYGGPFGRDGRFALATQPCLQNGLHAVRFMVIDDSGGVLSIAFDKLQALSSARRVLCLASPPAANDDQWEQPGLWPDNELPVSRPDKAKAVSRRRREIFGRSEGRCHYCTTPLTLNGKWHIEHMLPKALGGGDSAINLVAACPACNLAKSDRSALEFVAALALDQPKDGQR
ncbi:HNH endonuclease signature motif containing protein [Piscinibacter gummiphilus]|uniref:HNH endonuclease signature motif containing protein n=1 Tax=Piscinibacter gummiphilus TaxID=946333 RepID=A0ABZ0D675_9BURK|nr:HNH endonuclease signature motif containing protein [Piscinibacter gummiphilus]WOB10767.1 HNH endonuclease signature motif containing protein [Piscinibacter gummiphilus]